MRTRIEKLLLFISATPDLRLERDVVARAVTEIPTSLGWTIKQTPGAGRESDLRAVDTADIHLLLLGRDIQAPVGLEWASARRAGRPVQLFRLDTAQTQAGTGFMREVSRHGAWTLFKDAVDLRPLALAAIGDHLVTHAGAYDIVDKELADLRNWRATLTKTKVDDLRAKDESGGVILTTERFVPKEGKLLVSNRRP